MTVDVSEKDFEAAIERSLLDETDELRRATQERVVSYVAEPGGIPHYRKRESHEYDRALCLIPEDAIGFIQATQTREWERYRAQMGPDARQRLLQRLSGEIKARGTLEVMRKGIKANGCSFKLAYFQPASGLNPELQLLYEANFFAEVRQLYFSERTKQSIDLALFLNGLPLFTAELKNPLKGQTVEDAIKQYRNDRDPKEPLFAFGRCLAHFAVDPDQVAVTTHLQGPATRFLPFNQGRNGGAGNPPSWRGFATSYLWERIWAPESVLDLVRHFVHIVEEENEDGKKTGKRSLIFPRYHQLDAVRRLVTDARAMGAGRRYLIQHSAGSGKSNSIAWLAHRLSILHDEEDRRVFDSIIVITDRRVLDRQLQRTVRQFEQTLGVVENIDTTSRQLRQALEDGKTIIVTTLQKFPVIMNQVGELPGRRFAVIVDEAHSSQSGESTRSLKVVLAVEGLEFAAAEEGDEAQDLEDRIAAEVKQRGPLPNVSYFAFTATPKPKTLELFGERREDGGYQAFSLYTMRQAIEERFILDVLRNYVTYQTYWSLLKRIADDPTYDRRKASLLLQSFVNLSEHAIDHKTEIMVEHFAEHVAQLIGGKAKAMIVTRSRLHAVRFKRAVDRALVARGLPYRALVAFSGPVDDGGITYTEANMNRMPEARTAKAFERDEYRILIVANKFQTGFDQPLLHTMYVDKKLGGVNAVQTLSRLNRVHPDKGETMVLDFANTAEEIQESFAPYYDHTTLIAGTDPNLLYDLQNRLARFDFYAWEEVERFADTYFAPDAQQDRLHPILQPAADRFEEVPEEARVDFRGQLQDYIRLYAFLSQLLTFVDTDLERLYVFARFLLRKLPVARDQLPIEVQQNIDIESYAIRRSGDGSIALRGGSSELEPMGAKGGYIVLPEDMEALSAIIRTLNEHFGTDFSEDDKVCIRELEERLAGNVALDASRRVNTAENVRLTFDSILNDLMQGLVDGHFKFYKQVNDDAEFARAFGDWLFERYLQRAKTA